MPEGPEIRRAADALARAILDQPLRTVWFADPALQREAPGLRGQRIVDIRPRGKALLTRFSGGRTLYSHNQLYGVWQVARAGERPDTARSLRVALDSDAAAILLYSASDIALLDDAGVAAHPFLQRLGPDILDPGLDAARVLAQLDRPQARRRSLAALLLDQGCFAGMGNYLRAEVLFDAGIAPQATPASLDDARRAALADALLRIPRLSYTTRGIEPAQGMRADHIHHGGQAFRFQVFDREGAPCPRCSHPVRRDTLAGRRLYWCPGCQT